VQGMDNGYVNAESDCEVVCLMDTLESNTVFMKIFLTKSYQICAKISCSGLSSLTSLFNKEKQQLKQIEITETRRIATRVRLLAHLLKQLKMKMNNGFDLSQFLTGTYYDAVVEAIEEMAGLYADERGQRCFARPSLIISVGNLLIKCCQVKKGIAIRDQCESDIKEADRFVSLYNSDWSNSMSCPSLASMKTKGCNKPVELPSTSDLLKLNMYTEEQPPSKA